MSEKVWRNENDGKNSQVRENSWEQRVESKRKKQKQERQIRAAVYAGILLMVFLFGFVTGKGCRGGAAEVQAAGG